MTDSEKLLGDVKTLFEEFKKTNDAALAAKADSGCIDSLLQEKVDKLNAAMDAKQDEYQAQLDEINATVNRIDLIPGHAPDIGNIEHEIQAFNGYLTDAQGKPTGKMIESPEQYFSYKKALNSYLRLGKSAGHEVMAVLNVGSDPQGGFYVTPDMGGKMVKLIHETSPMRALADVTTIGTDALEGFRDLDEAASGGWVGEKQSRGDTDEPDTDKWRIPVHEQFAQPKATQKMLDDSGIDIEAWLNGKVSRRLSRVETTTFYTGDGSLKPRGFLTYSAGTPSGPTAAAYEKIEQVDSGKNGAYADNNPGDPLIELTFKLKAFYRNGASFQMSRATLGVTRTLKDGDGKYLWLPDFAQGITSGRLLGFPINEAEDMPALATDSLSVAFGNWKFGYLIVDRTGIRVLRDPFTDKPNIKFYTTKRVGGDVSDFDAIKIMKFAA